MVEACGSRTRRRSASAPRPCRARGACTSRRWETSARVARTQQGRRGCSRARPGADPGAGRQRLLVRHRGRSSRTGCSPPWRRCCGGCRSSPAGQPRVRDEPGPALPGQLLPAGQQPERHRALLLVRLGPGALRGAGLQLRDRPGLDRTAARWRRRRRGWRRIWRRARRPGRWSTSTTRPGRAASTARSSACGASSGRSSSSTGWTWCSPGMTTTTSAAKPMKGDGVAPSGTRGVPYLVVGGGGARLRAFLTSKPCVERDARRHGLRLPGRRRHRAAPSRRSW